MHMRRGMLGGCGFSIVDALISCWIGRFLGIEEHFVGHGLDERDCIREVFWFGVLVYLHFRFSLRAADPSLVDGRLAT